jgi:hypothetical protein
MRARIGVIGVAAIAIAALVGGHGAHAETRPPLRVLFVGNSLTATNDLPAVVAGLARATGRSLGYRTIAFGGFALEDHWAQGNARAALASRTWDVIVMQQGPSALPESQVNLREWTSRFADEARAAGTRPTLLTVWPESYRRGALRDVIASYRRAAAAARADLFPAGLAWQIAWGCRPALGLYGPDGFHPSALGTYAAALVLYGRLFKAPLVGIRALMPARVGARIAVLLQKAAASSLGRRTRPPCRNGRTAP